MWRLARRTLLWMLPIIGVGLFLPWAIRDLQLFTDEFGAGVITVPFNICVKNLAKIQRLAESVVQAGEVLDEGQDLPSQSDCWRLLAERDPSIAKLECPHVHHPVEAYWRRPLAMPEPPFPYVVNPHLFTRKLSDWKATDIVVADSLPRHFSDLRGQGIRCILLRKWDGSWERAYCNDDQQPLLIQQINDFAEGIDSSDADESWSRFYTPPPLNLTTDYLAFLFHLWILTALLAAWVKVFRTRPTRHAASPL